MRGGVPRGGPGWGARVGGVKYENGDGGWKGRVRSDHRGNGVGEGGLEGGLTLTLTRQWSGAGRGTPMVWRGTNEECGAGSTHRRAAGHNPLGGRLQRDVHGAGPGVRARRSWNPLKWDRSVEMAMAAEL